MSNYPTPPPPPGSPPPPPGGSSGYGDVPPPPPGYGYGGGVGGYAQQHPKGTTILVLGILSLVCCGLLGPVAWIMGQGARKEIAAQPGIVWTNRGNITAGWVCGIISTVLLILGVVFYVLVIAIAPGNS